MPTHTWIGKEKVINHHRDVPFHILEHRYGFSAKEGESALPTGSGITGDNGEFLNEEAGAGKIREYIWYSETRTSYAAPETGADCPAFLGKLEDTAWYFFYEKGEITTLDYDLLSTVKTRAGQYVMYADNCLLPKEFMLEKNIIFKKIPRDITRF